MSSLCPFEFFPLLLILQCDGIYISAEVCVDERAIGHGAMNICVCSWVSPWDHRAVKPVCSPVGEERNKAKCQRQMASVIATCAAGPATKTLRGKARVDVSTQVTAFVLSHAFMRYRKCKPTQQQKNKKICPSNFLTCFQRRIYKMPGIFLWNFMFFLSGKNSLRHSTLIPWMNPRLAAPTLLEICKNLSHILAHILTWEEVEDWREEAESSPLLLLQDISVFRDTVFFIQLKNKTQHSLYKSNIH